jgi:L-alanine-DL-glutamate epimerase-like enolase superfamily enzyme
MPCSARSARCHGKALSRSQAQGFRVLKLKVGVETPMSELESLAALARHPSVDTDVRLRLDANGAWSFDQARWLIERLARLRLPIESIEEPLAEPTPERLDELQALAPFPLALDESLPTRFAAVDPSQLGVRRLVLKPAALGGLHRTLALARRAQDASIEVVVTSLVESAAGLWPTAQLAASHRQSHCAGTGHGRLARRRPGPSALPHAPAGSICRIGPDRASCPRMFDAPALSEKPFGIAAWTHATLLSRPRRSRSRRPDRPGDR